MIKKYRKLLIITIIMFTILIITKNTMAKGVASISGPSSVESGQSVTVTVNLNNIASWNIAISVSGAASGNTKRFADATEDASNTNKSFSFTCKSVGEGTIVIKVEGDMSTEEGENTEVNVTKTITVTKKQEEVVEKPIIPVQPNPTPEEKQETSPKEELNSSNNINNSNNKKEETKADNISNKIDDEKQEENKKKQEELSNNNLSSLSVSNYNLKPDFNENITEYELELPITEQKIEINAIAKSELAVVEGIGELFVNEGDNIFEICVISGNGEKKTYKINAKVIDNNPIKIFINEKEYTIVKRKNVLENPDEESLSDSEIKINNEIIPVFKNDTNGEIVIGVKDTNNNIEYFELKDIKLKANKLNTKEENKNSNILMIVSIVLGIYFVISVIIIIILVKRIRKNIT